MSELEGQKGTRRSVLQQILLMVRREPVDKKN